MTTFYKLMAQSPSGLQPVTDGQGLHIICPETSLGANASFRDNCEKQIGMKVTWERIDA